MAQGFRSLWDDGLDRVLQGQTDLAELQRVLGVPPQHAVVTATLSPFSSSHAVMSSQGAVGTASRPSKFLTTTQAP